MASWGQNQDQGQEEPVLSTPDDQPDALRPARRTEDVPGQGSSSGNPEVRSMNMALSPSAMSRASLGPSLALPSSPLYTGRPTTQLQPQSTPTPSAFSPSEESWGWGNREQNPTPGQTPLWSLADSYREDIGLAQQLDCRLMQQLLRECPEWEQLLNPTLKALLQSFLKSQRLKNPQEILLGLRDPQSEMRKLLRWLLGHVPNWKMLLDQSLRRILRQRVSSQGQQPWQGGQQGQTLQAYLPTSQQWQQQQQQPPALGGQQSQMLQVYLSTYQYSQQPQVLWPGQGGQQGQTLQAYLPTFQYPQQQPAQGGQQPQMLQAYLPMYQYSQQPQVLRPGQGGQQGQVLQAYMPTFQYSQQSQVLQPGQGGQQGQMLQVHQPTYQQWQQQQQQQPGLDGQQSQMLQAYLPTFQYPQQLSSAGQQPRGLQTHRPPHQGSGGQH